MQVIFFSYCMMVSLLLTPLQEATGSCWVESHVKIVPILTCAWLASQQKAPVKVRGTGVPSPGKEVPSPWQLHRAPATCLLGQPHMKREALCNPAGITPPNNAPLKERQKPCIKRCWGGARLWSPTTTNTDSSTASHLRKRLSPFSICYLCPPSALSSLGSGLLSAHSFSFALQCGEGRRVSDLIEPGESQEDPRGMCVYASVSCLATTYHTAFSSSSAAAVMDKYPNTFACLSGVCLHHQKGSGVTEKHV